MATRKLRFWITLPIRLIACAMMIGGKRVMYAGARLDDCVNPCPRKVSRYGHTPNARSHYRVAKEGFQQIRDRQQEMESSIKEAIQFIALHTPLNGDIGDEWDRVRYRLNRAIGRNPPPLPAPATEGAL